MKLSPFQNLANWGLNGWASRSGAPRDWNEERNATTSTFFPKMFVTTKRYGRTENSVKTSFNINLWSCAVLRATISKGLQPPKGRDQRGRFRLTLAFVSTTAVKKLIWLLFTVKKVPILSTGREYLWHARVWQWFNFSFSSASQLAFWSIIIVFWN